MIRPLCFVKTIQWLMGFILLLTIVSIDFQSVPVGAGLNLCPTCSGSKEK